MNATAQPLTDEYLRRLARAAQVLPRPERDELLGQIRSHLEAGLSANATEADVRNLLDELGSPDEIVAAARPGQQPVAVRRGPREIFALLLLVTGFPPILGWLVGVGLLLWSPLWNWRQKLVAVLVWPGGYFGALLFAAIPVAWAPATCSAPVGDPLPCTGSGSSLWTVVAIVVLVLAPILVAAYLYRAAGRQAGSA
jgi:hypothetical protein